ncbi:N-acetyl-gamma-glutamyl-phosphate reductase [Prosthecobacter debontii]|uniref:N-acetyl-gamma-glutamyl-phosphate reductase n=1 Tax=Prosthecobacter debontii TaxID=48467 RepID=A0A1T4Z2E6_9BACT|nr:N-acetyl-gamma-glutamyl-phosphate reductase [Prosthecobacter debontii]SKB07715.1 N-acetyl-gamma-glutamyl-phosphate reductase [Prosthecobacter debontii]
MSQKVKVAVLGASGYSGIELLRLLLRHPHAELVAVTSRTLAGKTLSAEFPRFRKVGIADRLTFSNPDAAALKEAGAEIAFLALPHGVSVEYAKPLLELGIKVIDLSADFRLRSAEVYKEFYAHEHPAPELLSEAVYALPEIRADEIQKARLIACPGCYPTSILLPLIPLLKAGLLSADPLAVSSMSGASGAGRNANVSLLFCEVQNSLRSYSVPQHRHLSEIGQELAIAAGREVKLSFVPHLVPVYAGICTTTFASLAPGVTLEQVEAALQQAYADQPFVRLLGRNQSPDTKHVMGTNFIDIGWALDQRAGRLILMSAEDNIGKGASSQAIQNFNLVCGFDPAAGLQSV